MGLLAIGLYLILCRILTAARNDHPAPVFAFHSAFSSKMVVQRAPASAQIYGILGNFTPPHTTPAVTVTVTDTAANGGEASYSVNAEVFPGGTWKALLKPNAAGGNFTISAECKGCSTKSIDAALPLQDVTFGDVWYAIYMHIKDSLIGIIYHLNYSCFMHSFVCNTFV